MDIEIGIAFGIKVGIGIGVRIGTNIGIGIEAGFRIGIGGSGSGAGKGSVLCAAIEHRLSRLKSFVPEGDVPELDREQCFAVYRKYLRCFLLLQQRTSSPAAGAS